MVRRYNIDVTGAMRKLERANKAIIELGQITANGLVESGKWYAKTLAPVGRTGRTNQFIKAFKATERNPNATLVAQNPTRGGANRATTGGRYGANFNLTRWMHETGGVLRSANDYLLWITHGRLGHPGDKIIKSGDPRFMYTTRDYLNNIKRRVARGNWNKLRIKL